MKYIQLSESFGAGTFIGACSDNILNSHTLSAIFSGRLIKGLNFSVINCMSKWSRPEENFDESLFPSPTPRAKDNLLIFN